MDTNHPIPQDVTGFQFKLIGNMTVKQFAYLAAGSLFGVMFFYSPLFIILKFLLIAIFAGFGAALAFLPIEGRPMDLMVSNFFKDLFSPTQYMYQKMGGQLAISAINMHPHKDSQKEKHLKDRDKTHHERDVKLNEFLSHVARKGRDKLDEREDILLAGIFDPSSRPSLLSALSDTSFSGHSLSEEEAMRVKMISSPDEMEHVLDREARAIKEELEQAIQREQEQKIAHHVEPKAHEHVGDLEKQLQDIMAQKLQLEHELLKLKESPRVPAGHTTAPAENLMSSESVRIVPSEKASSIGLPSLPDVPNVVIGIIRDPRGNVLSNILVEIKDSDGNPVRAFKTNGLGHFASATQMASGTYTIEFEDPKGKQQFEKVQIEVKGEIMLPIEIISHDAREDLRKELFA